MLDFRKYIKQYFDAEKNIDKYFGYKEDWNIVPRKNFLDNYWFVTGEGPKDKCVRSNKPFTENSLSTGKNIYSGSIYIPKFTHKGIYKGDKYTMISVDIHEDSNKLLMIFDNKKECNDEKLKKIYIEKWIKFHA